MPTNNFNLSAMKEYSVTAAKRANNRLKELETNQPKYETLSKQLKNELGIDTTDFQEQLITSLQVTAKSAKTINEYHKYLNKFYNVVKDKEYGCFQDDHQEEEFKRYVEQERDNDAGIVSAKNTQLEDAWDRNQFLGEFREVDQYFDKFFKVVEPKISASQMPNGNANTGQDDMNDGDDDDGIMVDSTGPRKIPNKCPLTQAAYERPCAIITCRRVCVFEYEAIRGYLTHERPCPTSGCGNRVSMRDVNGSDYMIERLREYIE